MTLSSLLFLLLSAFPAHSKSFVGPHLLKGYIYYAVNTADDSVPNVMCQREGDIREFVHKAYAAYSASEDFLDNATSSRYVQRDTFGRITGVNWNKYEYKHRSRYDQHRFLNMIHWSLLPCTVRKIDLSFHSLKSVCNQTLPTASDFPFLTELSVESNQLSGNVSWSELPSTLHVLNVRKNQLNGSVEWDNLPWSLMVLDISENTFTGSCELHSLPPALRELNASQNMFDGEICLTKLSLSLLILNVSNNKLSGGVDLSGLCRECYDHDSQSCGSRNAAGINAMTPRNRPPALQEIDISSNKFEGNVTLDFFLPCLGKVDISNNTIGPTVEIGNLSPSTCVDLRLNRISNVSIKNGFVAVRLFPQKK